MTERSPNADRLSVPYTPPSPTYIPVDSMAKIVKDLAYQVYFADPQSTDEIENNVRSLFRVSSLNGVNSYLSYLYFYLCFIASQRVVTE